MPEPDATLFLLEKLARTDTSPGVYLMKNDRDRIIYVGKARNLKKRLSSYFGRSTPPDMKTGVLVKQIRDFDTISTATEKEALILESNLIKRHRPRYNVVLKDDKRYPVLRIDVREPYPNLTIARKIANDGALYFGPYASSHAVRQTMKFIHKTFKLRKCRSKSVKPRSRPCLHCQIDGCLAPCCTDVLQEDYAKVVDEVVLFLKGRTPRLIRDVADQMRKAAERRDFEKAAKLRDKMFALEKTLEKQISATADFMDRDILATAGKDGLFVVNKLVVRSGFLVGAANFEIFDELASDEEILEAFVKQHYEKTGCAPRELLLPFPIEDAPALEEWLGSIEGRKVRILVPRRGEKTRLTQMAAKNAANALEESMASKSSDAAALERLRKCLRMDSPPRRIECFDNSNFAGALMSAGMVVFENARPNKSAYRKFKVRDVVSPDDYASMKEVLTRRFSKDEKDGMPFPDLLMVDGGRGQLGIAVSVLEELGLSGRFRLIGIAKKDPAKKETRDKIYAPGRANPLNVPDESLLFLQRIRDEAHRFAVSFHRNRRGKETLRSELDDIPGIGRKRKLALIKHFGGVSKIRQATLEQLEALPEMNRKVAEEVVKAMREDQTPSNDNP